MDRNNNSTRGLLAVALLAAAGFAQAQAQTIGGPYAQLSVGRSDFAIDCAGVFSCDNRANAVQVIGGYGFRGGWAVEGLYVNFGKSKLSGSDLKATALGAGGALRLDLSPNWALTVRLGLANVELASGGFAQVNDSSANLYAGVAVGYKFGKTTSAELGLLRARGEIRGDQGDITAFTAGLRFTF